MTPFLHSIERIFGTRTRSLFPIASLALADVAPTFADGAANSTTALDQTLRDAVAEKQVPGIVVMVWAGDRVVYQGAAGKRDTLENVLMTTDSIFRIASMTKPITSVAVMQLVESGKVKLDEPAATYLPELSQIKVLEEFDAVTGKAKLRPPKTPPTIRQLLTHTSGFVYDFFNAKMHAYAATGAVSPFGDGSDGFIKAPLMFDPGSRWEYGISVNWLGKLVEKISGQSLDDYFQRQIFQPLGMSDTFFNVPADKQARVAAIHQRREDGSFVEPPPPPFAPVHYYSGGGGLYSTASDYLKFERMLLDGGQLGQVRVLRPETVADMGRNQIGDRTLVELRGTVPQLVSDPSRIPSSLDKFGFGFGINTMPVEGGRAGGSLAWAGLHNTYFWIDPSRKICAVILMQYLPFSDDAVLGVVDRLERAVYATFAEGLR